PPRTRGPAPPLRFPPPRPGRRGRRRRNGRDRRDLQEVGGHPSLRAAPPPPRRGVPHARVVPARRPPPPTPPGPLRCLPCRQALGRSPGSLRRASARLRIFLEHG